MHKTYGNPYNIQWDQGELQDDHRHHYEKRYKYKNKTTKQLQDAYIDAGHKMNYNLSEAKRYYQWSDKAKSHHLWAEWWDVKRASYAAEMRMRTRSRTSRSIRNIRVSHIPNWLDRWHARPKKYRKLSTDFDRRMYARYVLLRNSYKYPRNSIDNYHFTF